MIDYKDLCILQLTEITPQHNEKEFIIPEEMIKDCVGAFFTCEFLKDLKYIIRGYYEDGNKYLEDEYKNGKLNGKSIWWYENGNKRWEQEFKNGKPHGKSTWWYGNGDKWCEEEWENGKMKWESLGIELEEC